MSFLRKVTAVLVAIGVILTLSASMAAARHYTHPSTTITHRVSGSIVASATVQASHGWVPVAASHIHSVRFNPLRDRSASDGRAVYGKAHANYHARYYQPAPGGRQILSHRWQSAGGTSRTANTASSRVAVATVSYGPRQLYGYRTIGNVCVDRRLLPDSCTGRSWQNTW